MKVPLLLAIALAAIPSADAATVQRQDVRLGVRDCQGALPSFEGSLRKRPLAIQNEGTGDAFVTCAFEGSNGATRDTTQISVILRNLGPTAVNVSCTLVDGGIGLYTPSYFTKTVSVAPGATTNSAISWVAADNGGLGFIYPAMSCNLPPGVAIPGTIRFFNEDVGA